MNNFKDQFNLRKSDIKSFKNTACHLILISTSLYFIRNDNQVQFGDVGIQNRAVRF